MTEKEQEIAHIENEIAGLEARIQYIDFADVMSVEASVEQIKLQDQVRRLKRRLMDMEEQ